MDIFKTCRLSPQIPKYVFTWAVRTKRGVVSVRQWVKCGVNGLQASANKVKGLPRNHLCMELESFESPFAHTSHDVSSFSNWSTGRGRHRGIWFSTEGEMYWWNWIMLQANPNLKARNGTPLIYLSLEHYLLPPPISSWWGPINGSITALWRDILASFCLWELDRIAVYLDWVFFPTFKYSYEYFWSFLLPIALNER